MQNPQNKLKVRVGRTLEGTIFEVVFLVLAILLWVFIVWLLNHAPSRVPTHYDFQGNVDGWGSPLDAVFPCLLTTVVGISLLLAAYFPHTVNIPVEVKTPRQMALVVRLVRVLALEMLLLTFCMAFTMLGSAMGLSLSPLLLILVPVGILIVTSIVFIVLIYRAKG
jgi:uncharacterized membrane protein